MRAVRRLAVVGSLVLAGLLVAGSATFAHEGYRLFIVQSGSMMPTYDPGDVVIDAPAAAVRPGEVITFLHSALASDVVTHRVTEVRDGTIHTRGDANASADSWDIRTNQVQGVVVASAPRLGYLFVYVRQPLGLASLITVTLGLILLWQLFFPSSGQRGPAEPEPGAADGRHRRPRRSHGVEPSLPAD